MADLDRFKELNDARGHSAGDAALAEVAEVLRREVREVDTAARIGGDEFAVLLPETDCVAAARSPPGGGRDRRPRARRGLAAGISLGVGVSDTDGTGMDDLMRRATPACTAPSATRAARRSLTRRFARAAAGTSRRMTQTWTFDGEAATGDIVVAYSEAGQELGRWALDEGAETPSVEAPGPTWRVEGRTDEAIPGSPA